MTVEREYGNYPLSIGTSLAIEGLLGNHPETTNTILPSAFDQLYVNLPTLIRNYFSAYSTEDQAEVDLNAAGDHLLDELYHLQEILSAMERPLELVIYHQSPSELRWQFPEASMKEPTTERQRFQHHMQTYVYDLMIKVFERRDLPIRHMQATPTPEPKRTLMLTHHPHHLLWVFRFTSLLLLESHTGRIKDRHEWGSKLHTVKQEDQFPLTRTLIQLLGDGVLFAGVVPKLRREVKAIAVTSLWHSLTTDDKVRRDLTRLGSPELKELVRKLK